MIVVDTSAIMAIVLDEPEADACIGALEAEDAILISAGTVAEALIVSGRRNVGEEVASLIEGLGFEVVTVTRPQHDASPKPMINGAGACIRPPSISATASPMRWQRNVPAACFTWATIFRGPISKASSEGRALSSAR